MNFFIVFLISFFLIVFLPYIYCYIKLKNPKNIFKPLHGNFAKLKNGNLFYEEHKSEKPIGQTVVLVHGFSTPSIVWKGIIPFLTSNGFDVLAYDHYGRGYSARPRVDYTKDFYISTLAELLKHLNIETKIHLVGYSMGGPIVGHFAEKFPSKVASVNLIAPAGYMGETNTSSRFIFKILSMRVISHYISIVFPSLMYGGSSSIKLSSYHDSNHVPQEELNSVYKEQMQYEGFTRSLLSTAKNFNLFDTKEMYQELGKLNLKVSVIWGTADEIVPINGLNLLKRDIPNINFKAIDDGYHDITYALPTIVGNFLKDQLVKFSLNE